MTGEYGMFRDGPTRDPREFTRAVEAGGRVPDGGSRISATPLSAEAGELWVDDGSASEDTVPTPDAIDSSAEELADRIIEE